MDTLRKYWYIFLVLIIERPVLIAVELQVGKLFFHFYSRPLYVWTTVPSITLPGLIPYHSGEIIYSKHSTENRLIRISCITAILVFALPSVASLLISTSLETVFSAGISFASFLLFVQSMFCFGLIGILALLLFNEKKIIALTP